MLESFASWLTPTSLFLLLNIVIGTIWITSLFTTHHSKHHQTDHYYRAPSLIDGVKSLNFGLYKYEPHHSDEYFPPAEHVYASIKAQQAAAPQLARAPSLLDRVKSVNFNDFQFSFFRSEFHHPEPHAPLQTQYEYDPVPVQRREPEPRVQHEYEPETVQYPVQQSEPDVPGLRRRALERAPSLLERVKSINLNDLHNHFSIFRSETPIPEPKTSRSVPEPVLDRELGQDHNARRSKSGGASRTGGKTKKPAGEKMKKSASEKMDFAKQVEDEEEVERRRPATARVERTVSIGGDVEVDAKADDFINKFKQQLKLQRLDSILQYRDMITRGASK